MDMKNAFFFLVALLALPGSAIAAEEHDFSDAVFLIESKVSCDELSDDELEMIGDYYMEQMHPGDAHAAMDEMMGGEGSESLRQVHISLGRRFYCGEQSAMSAGMMNMMMGRGMDIFGGGTMMNGFGMMGTFGMGLAGVFYFVLGAFVFSLIFWWTYTLVAKPKK